MLRSLKITFEGLDRFQGDVSLELGDRLTAIVGPNGSGKSTLLEAVAEVMRFLQHYRIEGPVDEIQKSLSPARSTRPSWTRATIDVEVDASTKVALGASFPEAFAAVGDSRHVVSKVTRRVSNEGRWVIESISIDAAILMIDSTGEIFVDSRRKTEAEAQLAELEATRTRLKTNVDTLEQSKNAAARSPRHTEAIRAYEAAVEKQQQTEKIEGPLRDGLQAEIKEAKRSAIPLVAGGEVSKRDLEAFMTSIGFPTVVYLQGMPDFTRRIEVMAQQFGRLHVRPRPELPGSPYLAMRDRLHALLKMDVASDSKQIPYVLLVDDRPVSEVSQGTWSALGFASVCEEADENALVIWDEPETSLHPTWARKICDLMLRNPRRFLIGTHRTEFAPITDDRVHVYKSVARPASLGAKATCRVERARGVVEGCGIAAALGLEPARVLFTTNAVIWVEGPSDVIYWRFWLRHAAQQRGEEILEGAEFSFMFTGGALLANETFAEEEARVGGNVVNLLHLVGASLVIVDTDFNPDDVERQRITRAELQKLLVHGNQREGFVAKVFWPHLQPRVGELLAAIEPIKREDSLLATLTTWGRETENALTDDAFRRVLRRIYGVNDEDAAAKVIDAVKIDVWRSYDAEIEAALAPSTGRQDLRQLWASTKDNKTIVSKMSVVRDKIHFANTYVSVMESDGLSSVRNESLGIITSTLEWILKVKAAYLQ